MNEEERVIRDWLAGQLSPSGAPLPPARRRSQPLPRRQVVAVVEALVRLLDEARAEDRLREAASAADHATDDDDSGDASIPWRDCPWVGRHLSFADAFLAALRGSQT